MKNVLTLKLVKALALIVITAVLVLVMFNVVSSAINAISEKPVAYQVDLGVMKTDGQAIFALRALENVSIVSIKLAGTNNYAYAFTPHALNASVTIITADFRNVNVQLGATYNLYVVLANGDKVLVAVVGE
jgi:hypothetical protein